jgi:hypothetical protein
LSEEQVSTAACCSRHRRHIGKLGVVGAHKLIKGFDAIISAGMAITVDDDEASAPDNDGRQSSGMTVPPLAYLLRLGARLFLPANEPWPLVWPRWENRHTRSGQIERRS